MNIILWRHPELLLGAADTRLAHIALWLAIILALAKLAGELASRLRQPAVLGELFLGLVLGNLHYVGLGFFDVLKTDPTLDVLAGIGVLLLLFEVGLEATVGDMMKVGLPSLLVALIGVVAPFVLGFVASAALVPESTWYVHAFLGATLCATSVGITARVLRDIGKSQSSEARVILGAAVIDDVLGIVLLAVISGLIGAAAAGEQASLTSFVLIFAKAAGFLVVSVGLGAFLVPRIVQKSAMLKTPGALLAVGLSLCFFLSYLAGAVGLAPIIGAFAAGLVLEDVHYEDFRARGEFGLEQAVHPIAGFLTPIFFVVMGARTDLGAFTDTSVLALASALTMAAILGKLISGLGVVKVAASRLAVGIGMVPRGEVGLIFANIGLGLTLNGEPVISPSVYSAVVVMVVLTTMLTPPALTWRLRAAD